MDKPIRILAVDNEPSVTLSLKFVFTVPRYQVVPVESGAAALARLEAEPEPFDVIIVDQKMPNLTGVQLVEAIRQRGISSKLIVLSADLSPEIHAAYQKFDIEAIFSKPFDLNELRAAVDRLMA